MPSYFTIHHYVINEIQDYCLEKYPNEGYGFLAGRHSTITHFFPVPCQNHLPCSLELEPRVYFNIIKKMRYNHLEWLGIMHSHPLTRPYPSKRDLSGWTFQDKSFWILSLKDKELQLCAYHIKNNNVIPLMFKVIE